MSRFFAIQHHTSTTLLALLLCGIAVLSYLRIALINPPSLLVPGIHISNDALHPGFGKFGALASERSACSKVGIEVYRKGGNAADAIISAAFCVGVIAMYHSGIGGGGWALVRSSNGSYENINFREKAPGAAREDMFDKNVTQSLIRGLSPGIPGELRALEHLHKQYAILPWRDLVQPAIEIARRGFAVDEDLLQFMNMPGTEFLKDEKSQRYAATLDKISDQDANAFYEGPIADATIAAISASQGIMTLTDLKEYTIRLERPLQLRYRDFIVTTPGAPSGGSVVLSTLKTVSGYPDFDLPAKTNLTTHLLDEALRFAYGQRSNLRDPSFVSGMYTYEQEMLNDTTASRTRSKISPHHTLDVSDYNPSGLEIIDNSGTTALVAVDADGMAISMTTSINDFFGSHIMVPETGIILNDHMNDFSIPNASNLYDYTPAPANFIRPGKRPLSSVTDAIVEFASNSSLYFAVSAAGGSHIITSVLQALWHVLDHGLSAQEALAQPRFHDQLLPNKITFDWNFDNTTVAFLASLGHNCTWIRPGFSVLQAVRRLPNGTLEAATDPSLHDGGAYTI